MWDYFFIVAKSVFTLFLLIAVGFFAARRGFLDKATQSQMSKVLLTVVGPCVGIRALQLPRTPENVRLIVTTLAVVAGLYAVYSLLVLPLFPKQPPERRGPYRFGVMFSNSSFMGLPLITSVLGQSAAIYCVLAMTIFTIFSWTYGLHLMGQKLSFRRALLNPGVIGFSGAVALFALGITLPAPVASAVGYLADLNTPLAMLIIGAQMAGADLLSTFRSGRLYLCSALKLLLLPLVTLALLLPLHLEFTPFLALVILSGCPVAGVTSMFSQMFDRDTSCAAQLVTLSTLLSLLTLPLLTSFAQTLFNLL